MGGRFRKSVKLGGARINLSKSGIGYSVGGKGYRVTKKAGGGYRTTASVPGTGLSYVKDYSGKGTASMRRRSSGGSGSNGKKPKKGTWRILIGIFCVLGGTIKMDSSSVVNAMMILYGGGFLWWGIRARQDYHDRQKYAPKPDVVERLAALSDEGLAEAKEYALNYLQEHRSEIQPTDDMARLVRAIRLEEGKRQGLEPEPESFSPQKHSKAVPIVLWSFIALCAIGVLLPSSPVESEPETITADQQLEPEPVVEPEAPQVPEPAEPEPVVDTVNSADVEGPASGPGQEPETVPTPVPETPAAVTPDPGTVVETPETILDVPADPLSGEQQYEETPEQGVAQVPEMEPEVGTIVVYITNSGDRYHSFGCRHLKESCIETTLDAAKVGGLTPCGHCHPPT